MADDFQRNAAALTDDIVAAADAALSKGVDEIVAEQQRRAPRKTGALANSIRKQRNGPLSYTIRAGGSATTKGGYDYAVGEEFGNHHSGAHPFFFSGYRAEKRIVTSEVANAVRKAVRDR